MKRTLLATLALCTLALTGCSDSTLVKTKYDESTNQSPDNVYMEETHDTMSNVDVIRCLAYHGYNGTSISCDWDHPVSTTSPPQNKVKKITLIIKGDFFCLDVDVVHKVILKQFSKFFN